jgi:hypothetical protein
VAHLYARPFSAAQNLSACVSGFLPPHQSIARATGSTFYLAMIVAMAMRSYSLLPSNAAGPCVGSIDRKIARLSWLCTGEQGS